MTASGLPFQAGGNACVDLVRNAYDSNTSTGALRDGITGASIVTSLQLVGAWTTQHEMLEHLSARRNIGRVKHGVCLDPQGVGVRRWSMRFVESPRVGRS